LGVNRKNFIFSNLLISSGYSTDCIDYVRSKVSDCNVPLLASRAAAIKFYLNFQHSNRLLSRSYLNKDLEFFYGNFDSYDDLGNYSLTEKDVNELLGILKARNLFSFSQIEFDRLKDVVETNQDDSELSSLRVQVLSFLQSIKKHTPKIDSLITSLNEKIRLSQFDHFQIFKGTNRLNYYLGNGLRCSKEKYLLSLEEFKQKSYKHDCVSFFSKEYSQSLNIPGSYKSDINRFTESILESGYLVLFGDKQLESVLPCFVKTRKLENPNGILLPLNSERHWNINLLNKVLTQDIKWENKVNSIVWRGSSTGYNEKRCIIVQNLTQYFNVGFSQIVQSRSKYQSLLKEKLTIEEQLMNKYILCIEGNDVATNLKWVLASNSVPIMSKPTVESWLMESMLIPFVHYVPVKTDFSDIQSVFDWCLNNDTHCKSIAENGKKYLSNFLDLDQESSLTKEIIKAFASKYYV
jgi:hypothetical protein